ncbi:MAG TPA: protein kinase, partial [Gemmatimonadaceae bacterium]
MSNETFVPAALLPDFGPNSSFGESYELIRELGRGGMAIVYLVRERDTGLERAVKVIHTKFVDDQEALARFDREARLVAQLKHPNIVATHSVQWIDGVGFGLVMDHVRGRTLKQILADGTPVPFDQATRVLDDIAAALGFAHMHGIVHRDVKPENIFIEEDSGHALLADFGIARSVQTETLLTLAGAAIGTPTYMAPEQIDGGALDARSDLYSLGLVGWEMLTGRRPWDGESLYNVIYRQKHDNLAAIDALRPDTPIALVCAIEGLLEKSPSARWQTAADFRAQLDSSEPPVRRLHDTSPAPDATVIIPIPIARRARGPLRRLAPIGAAAALLLSATLLFARPAPSWVPLVSRHADPSPRKALTSRRPNSANSTTTPAHTLVPGTYPDSSAAQGAASSAVAGSAGALVYPSPAGADGAPGESTRVPPDLIAPMQRVTSSALPPVPPVTPNVVRAQASAPAGARFGARFTLAAGGTHTCLIASNGSTYCWGANNAGQLGTGATQTRTTPSEVSGSERFSSIAPGLSHTCALTARGSLYCWGNNESGQLGDGSRAGHDTPTRVSGSPSLTSVVSGASFSCGLTNDGQALCWGAGSHGQIGDGATSERTTPATVSTKVTFASLAAGWNHVCALSESGAAYCWGANDSGELGDGTNSDRSTPTPVRTTLRFTSLSAGAGHTCGTTTGGTIYCWGDNRYGQLGDGGHDAHTTPVAVASSEHFVS